jgi:abhydrolase domain-containing protein 6
VLGFLCATALAGAVAYYAMPRLSAAMLMRAQRSLSGLKVRSVRIGSHEVPYLEGGSGETVLLLHGIFGEKDHWNDFARALVPRYRVIVPDLPGYGESTRIQGERYDYAAQTERLLAFVDALRLTTFHVAGSSMGGTLAALLAIRLPERVSTVAFVGAPHGIRCPRPSAMDRCIEAGLAPLVAKTNQAFSDMLALLFERRPFLPYPILHRARHSAIHQAESNMHMWHEQLKDRYLLHAGLEQLRRPLGVIWGTRDRVFDVSGAQEIKAIQPEAFVRELTEVGHLPMMETPGPSAACYLEFLNGTQRDDVQDAVGAEDAVR